MVSSKFYRPRMAALSWKEKIFVGLAENAGLNYFIPDELPTRRVVSGNGRIIGNVQISYSFSRAIRKNKFLLRGFKIKKGEYGAGGISFRMLYEFLCENFNAGEFFIDTYFDKIFDTRSVSDKLNQLNDDILKAIEEEKSRLMESVPLKADGTPDMRYKVSKRYVNYAVWQDPIRKSECARLAEEIRYDIVTCLSTGRIPLRKQSVSTDTARIRERFIGLDPNKFFFASGQLIKHLSIFVEIAG